MKERVNFSLDELRREMGDEATEHLMRAFGGLKVRVPRSEGSDTFEEIRQAIGLEDALKFVGKFGGENIYIPKGTRSLLQERNRKIIERFDELTRGGLSGRKATDRLSREFYLTGRTIDQIVNG